MTKPGGPMAALASARRPPRFGVRATRRQPAPPSFHFANDKGA